MGYGCMFILREARDTEKLRTKLICNAQTNGYGIWFTPTNNLLLEHSVDLNLSDYVFEVCNSFSSDDALLLFSHEGELINGRRAELPLRQRLQIVQDVALSCAPYAQAMEIYFGEDESYLPVYSNYTIACTDIADTLYKEYQNQDPMDVFVPCVHIMIEIAVLHHLKDKIPEGATPPGA